MFRHRSLALTLASALLLAACSRGPEALAPEQRPLVSELPAAERAQFRHLPIQGAPNFRDLGGYKTSDGSTVKWGMLYRTDALNDLTSNDQRYLERLNIKRIVDFRLLEEAGDAPDKLPPSLAPLYKPMPVMFNGQNYNDFVKRVMKGDTEGLHLDKLLVDANRLFVEQGSPIFREWLHGLVQTDGAQVFHCTAGKDRTGFAAAIFLLSLGVPKETVMQDYLLSNQNLQKKNESALWKMRIFSLGRADTQGVQHLMGVEPAYLQSAFDTMEKQYGSIDNYLREALGVDDEFRAQLRARYLEAAGN